MSLFPDLWHVVDTSDSKCILGIDLNGEPKQPKNGQRPFFQLQLSNFDVFYSSQYLTRRDFMKLLQLNGIDFRNPDNVNIILDFFKSFNDQLSSNEKSIVSYDIKLEKSEDDLWRSISITYNSITIKIPLTKCESSKVISLQKHFNTELFSNSCAILKDNKNLINQIKMKDQLIKFLLDEMLSSDYRLFENNSSIDSAPHPASATSSLYGDIKKPKVSTKSADATESYLSHDLIRQKIPNSLKAAISSYKPSDSFNKVAGFPQKDGDKINWNEVTKVIKYSNKLRLQLKNRKSIDDNDTDVDTDPELDEVVTRMKRKPKKNMNEKPIKMARLV